MRINIEKSLKRWLKKKVTITLGVIVTFMITGGVVYSNDGVINEGVIIKVVDEKIVAEINGKPTEIGDSWTNNGKVDVAEGNGIVIEEGITADKNFSLINNGVIVGNYFGNEGVNLGNGVLLRDGSTLENLTNSGVISGNYSGNRGNYSGNGVLLRNGSTLENLTNSGVILGNSIKVEESSSGTGVFLDNYSTLGNLINSGVISGNYSGNEGFNSGNGVSLNFGSKLGNLTNSGVILGNSIKAEKSSSGTGVFLWGGTLTNLTNYGIIAGSNKAISNSEKIKTQNNYGLLIDGAGTDNVKVNAGAGGEVNLGTKETPDNSFIINTIDKNETYEKLENEQAIDVEKINSKLDGNTNYIISNNSFKNLILNGYGTTLTVSGDLSLDNSIINGGAAKKYDENGEIISQSPTIKGSEKEDNLTLTNNSIINGNIDMGKGKDKIKLDSSTLNGGIIATDDTITMDKSDINGNSNLINSNMDLTSTTLNGDITANGGKINISGTSNKLFNVGATTINGDITLTNGEIYVKGGSIINGDITLKGSKATVWLDKNQAVNGKITIDESVTEKFLGVNYNITTDEDMTSLKNQADKFKGFDLKLKDGGNTVTLTELNISSITGGSGADIFKTTIDGLVGKTVDGGEGSDILEITSGIFDNTKDNSITIKNIEELKLANENNNVDIGKLSGIEKIVGGSGADIFKTTIAGLVGKTVDGGEGSDTLALLDNILSESNIDFSKVTNVENLQLADGGNTLDVSKLKFETITGGNGDDIFKTTIDGLSNKTISGGEGSDTLEITSGAFDNTEKNILEKVTGVEELKLASANNKVDIDKLTGFNKIVGGSGDDIFKTTIDGLVGKTISGGEGSDILEITSGAFDNTEENILEKVTGVEELKLASANNKVDIDKLTDFNKVVGNDGADTFIANNKDKFIKMTLDGGKGEDNLQLGFTADNSSTDIFAKVSNIENLTLTAKNNNLTFNKDNNKFDTISFGEGSTDNTISLTDVDTSISFVTSGNNVVNISDSDYKLSNHISGANTINLQGDKEWSFEGNNIIAGKDVNINSNSGFNLGITYDGVIKVDDKFIADSSNAILNGDVKISFDGVTGIKFDSIDTTHTLSFGKLSLGDSSQLYIPAFLKSEKENSNTYTLSVKEWSDLVGNSSLDIYTDRYNTAITKYNQEGYWNLTTAFNNFSKGSIIDYITDDNELGSKLIYTSENKTYNTRVFKDGETILINGEDNNLTFNDIVVTGIGVAVENGNNTLTLGGIGESSVNVGEKGINTDNSKVAVTLNISGKKNNNISSISMKNDNNNTINLNGNNITVGDIAFGSGDNNLVIDKISSITSIGEISSTSGDTTDLNKITITNAIQEAESEKLLNLLNKTQNSIGSISLASGSNFVVNSQYSYGRDINLTSNNSITLEENGVLKADNIKFNGDNNQVTVNGGDIVGTLTFGEGSGDIFTVNTGDKFTYNVVGADTINLGGNKVWTFEKDSSIISNSLVNINTGNGYVKMEIGKDGQISSYNPFQNGTTVKIDNLKFVLDSSVIFESINEQITLDTNITSSNLMVSAFLTNNNGTLSIKKAGELEIDTLYQGNYEYLLTNYYNRDKDENGVITGIFNNGSAEDIKNKVENMKTEEQHFYSFKGEVDTKLSLDKLYIETTSDESVADKGNDITFNDFAITDDFIINVDSGTKNNISILGDVALGKGIDASQSEGEINLTLGGEKISGENMNITLGKSNDTLTILSDISATLDGNGGDNILNIGQRVEESAKENSGETSDTSKNIITLAGEIKNFSEFNLYQNTKLDSGLKLSMNGDNKTINLNENDLILGIDYDEKDGEGNITGHALYDNGITVDNNEGKLIVETSTASKNSTISMGKDNVSVIENGENIFLSDSVNHNISYDRENNVINVTIKDHIIGEKDAVKYAHLDKIYQSIVDADKIGLMSPSSTLTDKTEDEAVQAQLEFYGQIYNSSPYAYSNDISRETANMVNSSIMDSRFKADEGKWLHYGAMAGQGYDDDNSYYGRGYYNSVDLGVTEVNVKSDIYSAYYMGEYGKTDRLALGYVVAGNNSNTNIGKSDLKGSGYYLGTYAKYNTGNLRLIAGLGYQHNYYKADRRVSNDYQSMAVEKKYTDDTLTAYSGIRYIHNIDKDLTVEPYAKLSLTHVMQHSINERDNGDLSISVDGKDFTTVSSEIGVDLVKSTTVKDGKVNLIAGLGAEFILDGYKRENLTAKINGSNKSFDIVSEEEENFRGKISLGVEYEKTNGVFYNAKGSYIRTEDNNNYNFEIGLGYKF